MSPLRRTLLAIVISTMLLAYGSQPPGLAAGGVLDARCDLLVTISGIYPLLFDPRTGETERKEESRRWKDVPIDQGLARSLGPSPGRDRQIEFPKRPPPFAVVVDNRGASQGINEKAGTPLAWLDDTTVLVWALDGPIGSPASKPTLMRWRLPNTLSQTDPRAPGSINYGELEPIPDAATDLSYRLTRSTVTWNGDRLLLLGRNPDTPTRLDFDESFLNLSTFKQRPSFLTGHTVKGAVLPLYPSGSMVWTAGGHLYQVRRSGDGAEIADYFMDKSAVIARFPFVPDEVFVGADSRYAELNLRQGNLQTRIVHQVDLVTGKHRRVEFDFARESQILHRFHVDPFEDSLTVNSMQFGRRHFPDVGAQVVGAIGPDCPDGYDPGGPVDKTLLSREVGATKTTVTTTARTVTKPPTSKAKTKKLAAKPAKSAVRR